MSESDLRQGARDALIAINSLDSNQIPRTAELGSSMNFSDAVEPFQKLQSLFSGIDIEYVDEIPTNLLVEIMNLGSTLIGVYNQILQFDPNSSNPVAIRNQIVQQLKDEYGRFFQTLTPLFSFCRARKSDRDFTSGLIGDAEKEIVQIKDKLVKNVEIESENLTKILDEGRHILQNIKSLAGEAGVSKMVNYFEREAELHEAQAKNWRTGTWVAVVAIIIFSFISFFFHRWFEVTQIYEIAQLAVSKALIFFTIAYALILSARNFLSHKHNAIVNRHRHNALLTFKTIADAASLSEGKDTVLTYAAACIFAQQETGYVKPSGQSDIPTSVIKTALTKMGSSGG